MSALLGVRREDKNEWEKRVPLIPEHIRILKGKEGLESTVQPSKIRVFTDSEYEGAGARVSEDLSGCKVVFAIKEIPSSLFRKGQTYMFFSHTIKGQKHNMPMLRKMMETGCNLFDYEKVTDPKGKRLIFFGRFAGLAGMIDTLWAYGGKLSSESANNPLKNIKRALQYGEAALAKEEMARVGHEIKMYGFDERISPVVCAFLGYGNVSIGAQEIFDILPHEEITPKELLDLRKRMNLSRNVIYKVVFKEEHLVKPKSEGKKFTLDDYYKNPSEYSSDFEKYIEHINILVNCIYWDSRYPRFVTKEYLKNLFSGPSEPNLKAIGDITCDIGGSIECNVKCTDSGDPVYVYDPESGEIKMGFSGRGVAVLGVDNLPCELPKDSSRAFSETLMPFVPPLLKADFDSSFDSLKLPPELKKALILHKGKLTPNYKYLEKFL